MHVCVPTMRLGVDFKAFEENDGIATVSEISSPVISLAKDEVVTENLIRQASSHIESPGNQQVVLVLLLLYLWMDR